MKQFRLTIILLVVVAAVGAYIWFFERGEVAGPTAWKLDVKRIQRIELTSGGETSTLERKGETWRITKPVSAPVDRDLVKQLLDRVAKVGVRRTISEPKPLERYGLAKPAASIKVGLDNGQAHELRLGDKTPDGSAVYAFEGGAAEVLVVDTVLLDDAVGGAAALRDRTALPFQRDKVQRIVLERRDGAVKLEKRAGQWRLVEPVVTDADTYAVDDFLMALEDMAATRFVAEKADDPERYGLSKPRLAIAVATSGAKKPARISFGAETDADEYYARNSLEPAVMAVSKTVFDGVDKSGADLRSKMIAAVDVDDVRRLVISRGTRQFDLRREGKDRWRLTAPRAPEADARTIEDLLWGLSDLRAEAFVDAPGALADYGLDPPQAAATIHHGRRDQPVRIRFGAPARRGRIYAKAAADTIYEIPSDILGRLPADADELRDLTLLSYDPGEIERLRAAYGGKTVALDRNGTKWRLTAPEKRDANPERVQELLLIVELVRAEAFVADTSERGLPGYGSDEGTVRLAVETKGKPRKTLGVREAEDETRLKLDGSTQVFRAAPGFVSELKDALNAVAREK